jgi:NAD(P)-dependent dehydrogenase (short-subunit alcohol dehydrogenase family)
MRLENKVAIVTGAASGIGKDIAALFAREGARVVIADLNQKGADAVATELGGAKRAIGVAVDVTNEVQTETCVAKTIEAFGRLDILISNAGIQTVAPTVLAGGSGYRMGFCAQLGRKNRVRFPLSEQLDLYGAGWKSRH